MGPVVAAGSVTGSLSSGTDGPTVLLNRGGGLYAGRRWPENTEVVNTSTAIAASRLESAALLGVVADPVRWRLLRHLADGRTRCVCDLKPVAAVAANLLSYHLRALREAGLVRARRRGRWMDYTIADDAADRLQTALPTFTGRT